MVYSVTSCSPLIPTPLLESTQSPRSPVQKDSTHNMVPLNHSLQGCTSLSDTKNVSLQRRLLFFSDSPWMMITISSVTMCHLFCIYSVPVQFSRSVMSDSLQPRGLQCASPPCPSPAPRAYSDSCPLRQWCHPTISSSVIPLSSCLQYFSASGSFLVS